MRFDKRRTCSLRMMGVLVLVGTTGCELNVEPSSKPITFDILLTD